MPKLIFFIKSESVNLKNYTIKDIPGSSGRLDVISRCLLSGLLKKNILEKDIEFWVFLDNYGTYIFQNNFLTFNRLPKNELLFTEYFVELIRSLQNDIKTTQNNNPLKFVKYRDLNIYESIEEFNKSGTKIFILKEEGDLLIDQIFKLKKEEMVLFIIGNQSGAFLESSRLSNLGLSQLSLGKQSYLASSVIKLVKLHFRL